MKIAVIRPGYHTLPETFVHYLSKKHEVDFIIPDSKFKRIYKTTNIIKLKCTKEILGTKYVWGINEILKKGNYDLINIGEETQYITAIFAIYAIKYDIPIVCITERYKFSNSLKFMIIQKIFYRLISKFIWKFAKVIIPHTKLSEDFILKNEAPKKKIIHLPVGIDNTLFHEENQRNFLNLKILTIARLIVHKNLFTLLKSINYLRNEFPDIELMVIGDGPLEIPLKTLASQLNLHNNIIWIKYINYIDLNKYYNRANLFVLPSKTEVIGISALEAMATGLPLILSKVGGLQEFVVNGYNGFLFEPLDYFDLAKKIKNTYINSERFSKNSKEFAYKKFFWEKIINKYNIIFQKVVNFRREISINSDI